MIRPGIGSMALCSLFLLPVAAWGDELRAGTACRDITPPPGFPLWGYSVRHDLPSQGIHDALAARILVLEVGKTRIAIVSLDLGRAPTRQSMAVIREQIKSRAGIDLALLVASHTHSGPVVELDNWPTRANSYVGELEKKIVDGIVSASQEIVPARLGVASRQIPLNRNRHSRLANAQVDDELVVVRIETAAGKPLAHLVNFAAHATLRDCRDREISADYPGEMRQLVEKQTGVPCLFLQGAAGDLTPKPTRELPGAAGFGKALADHVLESARTIRCSVGKDTTLQLRQRDFQFDTQIAMDNPAVRIAYSLWTFPALIDFYAREYREGIRPQLATALLDGRIGFVGVSGEFFCAHSLRLKNRARLEHLLFLGYCNDYQQYFPTIEAVAQGGYGADAIVSPVAIGAGERMMDQALVDFCEMRKLIRPGRSLLEIVSAQARPQSPWTTELIYLLACIVGTMLLFPGILLSFIGAALFGPWQGTLYTWVGVTFGAVLAFFLAKLVRCVPGPWKGRIPEVDERMGNLGFRGLLMIRLNLLLPFSAVNFACGLTGMRFSTYLLGTAIGILPGTFVYHLLFAKVSKIVEGFKIQYLLDAELILAVALVLVLVLAVNWLGNKCAKNLVERGTTCSEAGEPGPNRAIDHGQQAA